jgi:hypothetical protein
MTSNWSDETVCDVRAVTSAGRDDLASRNGMMTEMRGAIEPA